MMTAYCAIRDAARVACFATRTERHASCHRWRRAGSGAFSPCPRRAGRTVTVAARRAEALAKTVDDIGEAKGQAHGVVMDVTAAAASRSALDAAEAASVPSRSSSTMPA